MSNSIKDKLLLFQARVKRDPEAFGKIYDAYVSRIYRFIYFKVQSAEEAEDLAAETFLKLWRYLDDGKPVRHLGALLYQIARTEVADYYRERPERLVLSSDALRETRGEEPVPEISGAVLLKETLDRSLDMQALHTSLRLLKDEYREVIVLRFLDELSPKEIAAVLGKTPGATRVLIHRALEALRQVASAAPL